MVYRIKLVCLRIRIAKIFNKNNQKVLMMERFTHHILKYLLNAIQNHFETKHNGLIK